MENTQFPYGVKELDPQVAVHPDDRDLVRCYVRGCENFVRRPTRHQRGELCSAHGIRCHHSSYGSTYSYGDVRGNIIASPDLFADRIVGHPFKFESHRLGAERSEDALSWNVFRSLQEASLLSRVATVLIGEDHPDQPALYLWGIRVDDNSFEPWDLLIAARERFENCLPVERPLTEPDIALHLPGKYLVLIEAKFTSPNTCYNRGPRKDSQSLTLDELLEIYWDSELRILDRQIAAAQQRVYYQLWRNMVLAEWMALADNTSTKAYHVNLVRQQHENKSVLEFSRLLVQRYADRFRRCDWETIFHSIGGNVDSAHRLLTYVKNKSAGLTRAFDLQENA